MHTRHIANRLRRAGPDADAARNLTNPAWVGPAPARDSALAMHPHESRPSADLADGRGKLSRPALAFRIAHAGVAGAFLLAIAYVWWCALTGRRGRLLGAVIAALTVEGVLVLANGGKCPLSGLQARVGDPVPLFELVLPPRVASCVVPVLGAVTAVGVAGLARHSRPPGRSTPFRRWSS